MSKKNLKIQMELLPNDCLCEIVNNIKEIKDFFNVTLTNKSFYDCFQDSNNAWGTKNIKFMIKNPQFEIVKKKYKKKFSFCDICTFMD